MFYILNNTCVTEIFRKIMEFLWRHYLKVMKTSCISNLIRIALNYANVTFRIFFAFMHFDRSDMTTSKSLHPSFAATKIKLNLEEIHQARSIQVPGCAWIEAPATTYSCHCPSTRSERFHQSKTCPSQLWWCWILSSKADFPLFCLC